MEKKLRIKMIETELNVPSRKSIVKFIYESITIVYINIEVLFRYPFTNLESLINMMQYLHEFSHIVRQLRRYKGPANWRGQRHTQHTKKS